MSISNERMIKILTENDELLPEVEKRLDQIKGLMNANQLSHDEYDLARREFYFLRIKAELLIDQSNSYARALEIQTGGPK